MPALPRLVLPALAACALLWCAGPAAAAATQVRSPDGGLVAVVRVLDGAPVLSARLDGRPLLAPVHLGVRLAGADLRRGLRLSGVRRRTVREAVRTVTGPRRARTLHAAEALLTLHGARTLRLRVRVADDG